jgi:hypothetical protein
VSDLPGTMARLQDELARAPHPGVAVLAADPTGLVARGDAYAAHYLADAIPDVDLVVVCHPDDATAIGSVFTEWDWAVIHERAPIVHPFHPAGTRMRSATYPDGDGNPMGLLLLTALLAVCLLLVIIVAVRGAGL